MWIIKKIVVFLACLTLLIGSMTGVVYFAVYDSYDDFHTDIQTVKQAVWRELFNRGYISKLSSDDIRYIYESRCYRQCHGESVMITAVLSPAGWFQVVERMRVKENVNITGREVDVIIKHLEQKYPTARTGYSYEIRKKVHHAVWRNDVGQGDIYSDVTYATPEYMKSIGSEHLINEYDLANYHVFIISLSVHDGEVKLFDMDSISFMQTTKKVIPTSPSWILRFQTADKHHFESVVRFKKSDKGESIVGEKAEWFELLLKNVGGESVRKYRWNLPITYPKEIYIKAEQGT